MRIVSKCMDLDLALKTYSRKCKMGALCWGGGDFKYQYVLLVQCFRMLVLSAITILSYKDNYMSEGQQSATCIYIPSYNEITNNRRFYKLCGHFMVRMWNFGAQKSTHHSTHLRDAACWNDCLKINSAHWAVWIDMCFHVFYLFAKSVLVNHMWICQIE